MKVTPAILQYEFIGLKVRVVRCSNPSCVGISGRVVDETRNTFLIEQDGERKRVIKDISTFHFYFPDGTVVEIDGKAIVGRPENRVKRRVRRRW